MKRDNINKLNILKNIKFYKGLPTSFSEKVFDYIFDIIIEGLKRDNSLKITGFGTFRVLQKKSRIGRNPVTGKEHVIKSRKVVTFHPSIELKKEINNEK